jgi:predicted nucleic acid-binding protein
VNGGVLVDTCLFVAIHNTRDADHERAIEVIRDITKGSHGRAMTTDYIFDEAVTTALVRTRNSENAKQLGEMMLGFSDRHLIELTRIDEPLFRDAWRLFQRYGESGLSFTDCTSLAAASKHKLASMATFDSHFNGILPVIR